MRTCAQQHALLQSTLTWQTPPAKRRSSGTSGPAGSAVTRTRRGKLSFRFAISMPGPQLSCRRRPRVRPTFAQLAEAARFRKVRRESTARTPEVPHRTGQTPAVRLHFLHCADGRIGTQPWHQDRSGGDEAHVQLRMAEAHLGGLVDGHWTEKRMGGSFSLVLQSLGRATQVLERRRRIDLVRHQYSRGPRAQLEAGGQPLDEQSLLEKEPTDGPDRQRGLKPKAIDHFVLRDGEVLENLPERPGARRGRVRAHRPGGVGDDFVEGSVSNASASRRGTGHKNRSRQRCGSEVQTRQSVYGRFPRRSKVPTETTPQRKRQRDGDSTAPERRTGEDETPEIEARGAALLRFRVTRACGFGTT